METVTSLSAELVKNMVNLMEEASSYEMSEDMYNLYKIYYKRITNCVSAYVTGDAVFDLVDDAARKVYVNISNMLNDKMFIAEKMNGGDYVVFNSLCDLLEEFIDDLEDVYEY